VRPTSFLLSPPVAFLALLTACGGNQTLSQSLTSSTPDAGGPGDAGVPSPPGAALPADFLPGVNADPTIDCQELAATYGAAVIAALSCDVHGAGQCQKMVPYLALGCPELCQVTVNDDSALTPLLALWNQLGCSDLRGYACLQGCRNNRLGICGAESGVTICDPDP
jgi:hypothetical protein